MKKPIEQGRISSGYGLRINPITKKEHFHGGLDIVPTTEDKKIVFPLPGKIEAFGFSKTFGNRIWVRINMPDNEKYHKKFYVLAHMDSLAEGLYNLKSVKAGEFAGICGSTGNSTGTHLHFEIANTVNDERKPIEPTEFVKMYAEKSEEKPKKIEEIKELKQIEASEIENKTQEVKEKKSKKAEK